MRRIPRFILLAVGMMLVIPRGATADEPAAIVPYRVSIDGQLKIKTDQGGSSSRRTQVELDYRNARRKDGVDIAIDKFIIKATVDGQELDFVEMSRSRLVSHRADRPIDIRREQAPPAMQPFFAQFDPPIASIELDAEGGEISRKGKGPDQEKDAEPNPDKEMANAQVGQVGLNPNARPGGGGGPLLGAHIVDMTRLFHPRFPRAETKWEAPVVLPFGRGQVARGVLRYTKKPDDASKDGLVPVDVTGFLKVTGTHDLAQIKRGEYKVAGKQTYDTNTNTWVSGRLTVAIGWDAQLPNGVTIHGGGPATYTFTRREPAAATTKTKGARKKS